MTKLKNYRGEFKVEGFYLAEYDPKTKKLGEAEVIGSVDLRWMIGHAESGKLSYNKASVMLNEILSGEVKSYSFSFLEEDEPTIYVVYL
jgi:hypothetical protein